MDRLVDVLIVGAGISGIAAAHHLKTRCPGKRLAILEARECIGGTWDLFRYPGIRSDSDMHTMGYSFRPWRSEKSNRRRESGGGWPSGLPRPSATERMSFADWLTLSSRRSEASVGI